MTHERNRVLSLVLGFLILAFLSGCATTGRGEFPAFPNETRSDKRLAVLPPIGATTRSLNNSVLYHLNRNQLEGTFESVRVVSDKSISNLLGDRESLETLSDSKARQLSEKIDADWLLAFFVHDLRFEQFSTRDTERLQSSETRYGNIDVDSPDKKSGDRYISSRQTEYSIREVPVTEDNIRVVLSMSAAVYDLNERRVLWSGRRIERAEDEVQDLSAVELRDIVVERVMYRIISRLTG